MLEIQHLCANVGDTSILKGLSLSVKPGEVHAIMGPNGSGKSTLSNVIAGHPQYTISSGSLSFEGHDLVDMAPEERAALGIFLAFQYPVEIPGVNNLLFLKTAYNSIRKQQNLPPLDAVDFMAFVKEKVSALEMSEQFLHRAMNEGFSGGEKKRNAILQMLVLEPKLAILDETDSGLDIDALQIIARGVNHYRREDRGILLITHYQRLLDYIQPDVVHVLVGGKIVKSGDASLALQLEEKGYHWLTDEASV